jgi:hypothetical protein
MLGCECGRKCISFSIILNFLLDQKVTKNQENISRTYALATPWHRHIFLPPRCCCFAAILLLSVVYKINGGISFQLFINLYCFTNFACYTREVILLRQTCFDL